MSEPSRAARLRSPLAVVALLTVLALGVAGEDGGAGSAILAGYGSSLRSDGRVTQVEPAAGHTATAAFSISGSMKGLFPGTSRPLVLIVSNPLKSAIDVTSIKTTVGAASNSCRASNVKVSSFAGKLLVHAGGKAKVTVHVTMARAAPNACQGKLFPFHYSGSATEA